MLEQLSDRIRQCHEQAAEARAAADAATDQALKAGFLGVERTWLALAHSHEFAESLEDFTAGDSDRLRAFDLKLHARVGAQLEQPLSAEQILWSIFEHSDDAIITKNLDGIISSWNKSAEQLYGYSAEEAIGKPVTILMPPERYDEEPVILARIRRGELIRHYETVRRRKDGTLLDISLTVSPIKNARGEIIGASKIARDITERKRNDARFALLAREAEHRTKNILSTVQATVNLSRSDTAAGLKRAIEGRLQALANVHSLFVKTRWDGAELSSIITQELAPYVADSETRAQIDGPHVLLTTNMAQAVAMSLHELATNAAKYGCLSVPGGTLRVTWSRAADGRVLLHWDESGGPPATEPTRHGLGLSIIKRMIGEAGEAHFDWREQGLACEIILAPTPAAPLTES